jgi:CRP-like cAMP-binding protein
MKKQPNILEKFFESGRELNFKRRQVITAIDEDPEGAYFISAGHVKAISHSRNGEETILYLYGPGEVFPVTWLFDSPIAAVVFVALDEVKIRLRSKPDFLDFVTTIPGALFPVVCQQLIPLERIYNLMRETAQDKIIHSLMTMTKRFGEPSSNHMMINIHLTQQEVASTVRVSRETAGRVLNDLEKDGVIIQGRRHIRVFPDKLQKLIYD